MWVNISSNVLQKEVLCKNVNNFIKTDSSMQQHIGPTTAIWLNKLSSQKVQAYMYWTISNSASVFIIINSLSYFCSMKSFTRLMSQGLMYYPLWQSTLNKQID